MESGDVRIFLVIIVIVVVFTLGRKWQRSLDAWRGWRKAVAAIPGQRKGAFSAVGVTVKALFWAAVIVGVVAALIRFR